MTHVALLHYSCPPVVGGVEEVVRHQANVLAHHGHQVRVVAGAGGSGDRNGVVGRHGVTVQIHPLLASGAFDAVTDDPSSLDRGAAEVEAVLEQALEGIDVVMAHNVLTMPFNLPLAVALRRIAVRHAPVVVGWNHDSPYFYPDYPARLDAEPWAVLRRPDPDIRWVTISQARAGEFADLYGGVRPAVVPNGIDPHSFLKLEPQTSALVREEGLFEAELVMVQPSRLHPRKNVELSLRVLAALRARDIDARLLITGAHDPHDPAAVGYATALLRLAAELSVTDPAVMLAGYTLSDGSHLNSSQLGIRDLYQVADVLFLPSRSEGFGLPLLEAALIRLPIACADIPVLREVAGDGAYLFDLDDPPERIADGLLAHLDTMPTHRVYRRVVPGLTWEHVYQGHLRPLLLELAS
jgi:mannosylglucosylglycerate synthase